MLGSKGRSQRRHGIGEARLVHGDHIHVALADQHIPGPGCSCEIQAIQIPALIKKLRFRGVQIFGLSLSHDAPSEADEPVIDIQDREHDPVPELVVSPLPFIYGNQSGLCDHLILISFGTKIFVEVIAVLVGISQAKRLDGVIPKFPVLKIGERLGALAAF